MRLKHSRPFFLILVIGVFLFYWFWFKQPLVPAPEVSEPLRRVASEKPENQTLIGEPVEVETSGVASEAVAPGLLSKVHEAQSVLRLSARVNLALGSGASTLQGRVGPTEIDEADEAAWLEDEGTTAATDFLELATVSRWLDASVDSTGLLGPVPVPPAESYRLLAWESRGTLYFLDYRPMDSRQLTGDVHAGRLERFDATGVLVDLPKSLRDQGYAILVQRVAEDTNHPLRYALHLAFPEIASAYDGTPLSLDESLRLAPLFPDEVVRLTVVDGAGRRGAATDVALKAGSLVRWRPTGDALPSSQSGRILSGRIIWESDSPLPEGLRLQRMGRDDATIVVEPDGHFLAGAVSTTRPTRFRLDGLEVPESGRPLTPETPVFVYEPDDEDGESVDVVWEIPLFRWLLLGLTEQEHERLRMQAPRGYPVFLLEQANDENGFQAFGSDVFLQEPQQLAVSIAKQGRYRVLIALSPLFEAVSDSVPVALSDHEVRLGLPDMPDQINYQLRCLSLETGEALANTPIQIVGPSIGLPPMRILTDGHGLVELGPINIDTFFVSLGDTEREVVVSEIRGTEIRLSF